MDNLSKQTPAWLAQCWISFGLSSVMTLAGIWQMSMDVWAKGYLLMGMIFTIGSCFNLAKSLRDEHEARRILNRISEAKTEKILREFETVA